MDKARVLFLVELSVTNDYLLTAGGIVMLGVTPRWRTIRLGLIWMVLTLAFEFGLGHCVLGDSWSKLHHASLERA